MDQALNVLTSTCPSRTSLAKIANKWTALVVISLGGGPLRFGKLRARVEGISAKVLTDTLRALERDGMLLRRVITTVPSHVEYELTDLGEALYTPLRALGTWAENHTMEVEAHRAAYDDRQVHLPPRQNHKRGG